MRCARARMAANGRWTRPLRASPRPARAMPALAAAFAAWCADSGWLRGLRAVHRDPRDARRAAVVPVGAGAARARAGGAGARRGASWRRGSRRCASSSTRSRSSGARSGTTPPDMACSLFGDMPIFVAHDSADVWSARELFLLDAEGQPLTVAGVPPDYFSADGQRWGNPHYAWDAMARDGFAWWRRRIASQRERFDLVRIDHFRGFEACWHIPREAGFRGARPLGAGPGRGAARGAARGERRRHPGGRESRHHHAASRATARALRPAGHADPAVRLRRRCAQHLPAAQPPAAERRLHRHP